MESFNDMLSTITDFLKTEVKTETLIGQPFQVGEYSCVPIMKVGMGFGAGGGEGADAKNGKGAGGGGGAGIGMEPVGFLVSRGDQIQYIAASRSKGITAAVEKLPDLIEKVMDKSMKKKADEAE